MHLKSSFHEWSISFMNMSNSYQKILRKYYRGCSKPTNSSYKLFFINQYHFYPKFNHQLYPFILNWIGNLFFHRFKSVRLHVYELLLPDLLSLFYFILILIMPVHHKVTQDSLVNESLKNFSRHINVHITEKNQLDWIYKFYWKVSHSYLIPIYNLEEVFFLMDNL